MHATWCLAARKGGPGKSFLSRSLAVHGLQAGIRTAILDVDPQGSQVDWMKRRGLSLPLVETASARTIAEDVRRLHGKGAALLLIDTRPEIDKVVEASIHAADYIVIPTEPSPESLPAIAATIGLVRKAGKEDRACIVVNRVPPGQPGERLARAVATPLAMYGIPVCPHHVVQRIGHGHASAVGRTAIEDEPSGPGAKEVARVWEWLAEQAGLALPAPTA